MDSAGGGFVDIALPRQTGRVGLITKWHWLPWLGDGDGLDPTTITENSLEENRYPLWQRHHVHCHLSLLWLSLVRSDFDLDAEILQSQSPRNTYPTVPKEMFIEERPNPCRKLIKHRIVRL